MRGRIFSSAEDRAHGGRRAQEDGTCSGCPGLRNVAQVAFCIGGSHEGVCVGGRSVGLDTGACAWCRRNLVDDRNAAGL